MEIDNSTGDAKGCYLFTDYQQLTPADDAHLNQWYVQFTPVTLRIEEAMNWTMQYFKNNGEIVTFAHFHALYMMDYPAYQQGASQILSHNMCNIGKKIAIITTNRPIEDC